MDPLRVLVVDDNVDAAVTLAMLVQVDGHQTKVVHRGFEVLDAALGFAPHVILLDIGMPGMDGYEVATLLRRERLLEDTLIVAVTGWNDERRKEAAKDAGFDIHLVKPVPFDVLHALLTHVAEWKSSPEASV